MPPLSETKIWLSSLQEDVGQFMETLKVPGQIGHFRPCVKGPIKAGEKAALGFSCFGLKIYYSLGYWDRLSKTDQDSWLDFIRSYQILDRSAENHSSFVDPHLLAEVIPFPKEGKKERIKRWLRREARGNPVVDAYRAETKQAIATLAQVGGSPATPFYQFPQNPKALHKRLNELPWSTPWAAGAQVALLSVFLRSQGPLLDQVDEAKLIGQTGQFLEGLVDPTTGCYFRGPPPLRGQLINGAMKVLNALDWLELPIHYPETLIDTCLEQGPPATGCHVVDWVYVVHRCLIQTNHRKGEIQAQCQLIAEMIKTHQNTDLGFSYEPGKAQQGYYRTIISQGLNEGDIHGSCLLIRALSMVVDILELDQAGWKVIRP
jgi:hypothetical protein